MVNRPVWIQPADQHVHAAELGLSSSPQKRAADLNDATHVARTELSKLIVDQPLPTLAHSEDRHILIERAAGDSTYGRIHARGVTTTRRHCDLFDKF
jgi:hypothetical protein